MGRKLIDLLKLQDPEAKKNTYFRARKKTPPTYVKGVNHLLVSNGEKQIKLYRIDEIVLYLLQDFKFLPLWLVQQWYADFGTKSIYNLLEKLMSVGLIWVDTDPSGVFLRPTVHLLDLYKNENIKYTGIPKMFLNHSFSEAQVVFDILMGNRKSEFWNIISEHSELLPTYEPLGIEYTSKQNGALVIRETAFRQGYNDIDGLLDLQNQLKKEIALGRKHTKEFDDFKLFQLVYEKEHARSVTGYKIQIPDIVVPSPRGENGEPNSYAVEIELTAKSVDEYTHILKAYSNNYIYGKLYYLCRDNRIARDIASAYEKIGRDMGSCKLYLMPFTPPAMKLDNYSMEDEENIKKVLKLNLG